MSDMTTAAASAAASILLADGVFPAYSAANCYLAVGDSSTAFTPAQTDLQAATNKLRKIVTSASRSGAVLTYTTTYSTSEANFQWNEIGVFNDPTAGTMFARKVQAIGGGPKPNTEAWTLQVTLTLQAV